MLEEWVGGGGGHSTPIVVSMFTFANGCHAFLLHAGIAYVAWLYHIPEGDVSPADQNTSFHLSVWPRVMVWKGKAEHAVPLKY